MIFSQRSDTYVKEIDHSLTGLHGFCPAPGLRLVRPARSRCQPRRRHKEQYAEAKVLPRTTIGYKRADRDQYGNQNDIYAKYNVIGSKVQLLGGWRNNIDEQSSSTSFYGGIGVAAPHILGLQPYATYVKGSHFAEAQAGLNYNIAFGWGLNVNYHNYMPEDGDNEHGVGAGVTFHF